MKLMHLKWTPVNYRGRKCGQTFGMSQHISQEALRPRHEENALWMATKKEYIKVFKINGIRRQHTSNVCEIKDTLLKP